MSYNMSVIDELVLKGNQIYIIEKNKLKNKTPLNKKKNKYKKRVFFYSRKKLNYNDIKNLVTKINPSIILVCGWIDLSYLLVIIFLKLKKKYITTVLILDSHWKNTLKQKLLAFICKFGIFNFLFDKAWIAGTMQFEYIRRLGFDTKNIIFDHFSADINYFNNIFKKFYNTKKNNYPFKFLFIGRREKIKGLENLLLAWREIEKINTEWKLKIIGTGSLKLNTRGLKNIEVSKFKSHLELKKEIKNAGCFILPSTHEPWGVVVHEMAAAGMPLLLSERCGARYAFLINGKNGFVFDPLEPDSIKDAILQIIKLHPDEILKMSKYSNMLSRRISPETSSSNLLSLANFNK